MERPVTLLTDAVVIGTQQAYANLFPVSRKFAAQTGCAVLRTGVDPVKLPQQQLSLGQVVLTGIFLMDVKPVGTGNRPDRHALSKKPVLQLHHDSRRNVEPVAVERHLVFGRKGVFFQNPKDFFRLILGRRFKIGIPESRFQAPVIRGNPRQRPQGGLRLAEGWILRFKQAGAHIVRDAPNLLLSCHKIRRENQNLIKPGRNLPNFVFQKGLAHTVGILHVHQYQIFHFYPPFPSNTSLNIPQLWDNVNGLSLFAATIA